MLARIERIGTAIERFFALLDARFGGANLALALFALVLDFGAKLECFVFGLYLGGFLDRFGLKLRIVQHVLRLFGLLLSRCVHKVTSNQEAEGNADYCADNCNDCIRHNVLFSSF